MTDERGPGPAEASGGSGRTLLLCALATLVVIALERGWEALFGVPGMAGLIVALAAMLAAWTAISRRERSAHARRR